ncbi:hypothetical protein MMC24_001606 [Lignoscripta atroalba]|nr:hypothetical protein [Lignoscripta atroalba]
MSSSSRGVESSLQPISTSSSSEYSLPNTSMQLDNSTHFALSSQSVPPFEQTKTVYSLMNAKSVPVQPEIHAKIDKGFFKADQDWTCYRRNYFSVACSYTLKPSIDSMNERLYLCRSNTTTPDPVESLSMCITAKVHGEDGKVIDLVQHTPKRDKGPMSAPEMVKLLPHQSSSLPIYSTSSAGISHNPQLPSDYDGMYPGSSAPQQQNQVLANFDRIQFKKATANNGKRRAAQQYFHIVVELYAEIPRGKSSETQCVKIASRVSAPMVVRGRSPGHYQDDRRGSSTSMGPGGGSSGDSAGGPRDPNTAGPPGGSHGNMPRMSFSGGPRAGNSTYQAHHASLTDSSSNSHSAASSTSSSLGSTGGPFVNRPMEPILTAEEANNIEEHQGYQYYPSPLFEAPINDITSRLQLPPVPSNAFKANAQLDSSRLDTPFGYMTSSPSKQGGHSQPRAFVKPEQHRRHDGGFTAVQSPSFGSHWHSGSLNGTAATQMSCGRFEGMASSRGYYPEMPAL